MTCRRRRFAGRPLVLAALACSAALLLSPEAARAAQLPYGAALGRAYDAVLDARFDAVEAELQQACGPAPPETCDLVRVTALWWRIQLDPFNRSLDGPFQAQLNRVIEAMAKWTEREPPRADAWFFLGAAYGVRVQYRVLRTERLSAARDGKRIKDALEKSLALDPDLRGRVLRHRPLPLLRGPRAGGAEAAFAGCSSCPAGIARRGCRRCSRRASAANCWAARPTTSST